MRFRFPVLAVLALFGCVTIADPSDLRGPSTPSDWAKFNAVKPGADRVSLQVQNANWDLCTTSEPRCTLGININIASSIGAFSDTKSMYISTGMLEYLRTDDERAMIIGHEWAHRLLKHFDQVGRVSRYEMERQADCVGALLAARAGFSIERGAETYGRMRASYEGAMDILLGSNGNYQTLAERYETLKGIGRVTAGRDIDRPMIQRVCGTAP